MELPRSFTVREGDLRVLNPIDEAKLATLGRAVKLAPGAELLDLCSGKGELLCTWARDHGITGTGVDISTVFTAAARDRATELGVADRVRFVHGDAAAYVPARPVDVACCVGATWIGGGVPGTLELLDRALRPGGMALVGEPYWRRPARRGDGGRFARPVPGRVPGPARPGPALRRVRLGPGRDGPRRSGQLGPVRRRALAEPAALAGRQPGRRTGPGAAAGTHRGSAAVRPFPARTSGLGRVRAASSLMPPKPGRRADARRPGLTDRYGG
ncbi:SAM-dependent methyltransferase [Micromonospora maritima]|uniref:SAM-dependent methyltransferase n=1 Tax=Micromonospora maritima TaxID=986711 RepID=UPI0037B6B93B